MDSVVAQSVAPSSAQPAGGQRERFGGDELAIVLSHYDLGVIKELREFPRGSRRSPKAYLVSETGRWLLKRRARGRDDAERVQLVHRLLRFLEERNFSAPHLLQTRSTKSTALRLESGVYELFGYIAGNSYAHRVAQNASAGKTLAELHQHLKAFGPVEIALGRTYHNEPAVIAGLRSFVLKHDAPEGDVLIAAYERAASRVERAGVAAWPGQLIHGDWHPGNMLFRGDEVVAALDFDSVRQLPRIFDLANAALHFSTITGDIAPDRWPAEPDLPRLRTLIDAYDRVILLSKGELAVLADLMIEALIAEAAFSLASTGKFNRFDGREFARMLLRKIAWLERNGTSVSRIAG